MVDLSSVLGDWLGTNVLTEMPGKPAERSEGRVTVSVDSHSIEIAYRWAYKGSPQRGKVIRTQDGWLFVDSWHQSAPMPIEPIDSMALAAWEYRYPAPPMGDWAWRIALCLRPDDTLVLQMTNITPWGEEAEAVKLEAKRISE
jgi:hypothetical protein